nr:hypothetical protein [Halobiforma nitratireducens]
MTDNNSVDHTISVGFEGDIQGHGQDGYPDNPPERTNQEDESISQARRFAKYHVYREKGYDTLSPPNNPDRIAGVLLALLELEWEAVEEYFETLHRQTVSHEREDITAPLDLPEGIERKGPMYKQGIYLEEDLSTITADLEDPPVDAIDEEVIAELTSSDQTTEENFFSIGQALLDQSPITDLTIEGVSGVHTSYTDDSGSEQVIEGDDPFDREPDACLELMPTNFDLPGFRFYMGLNLICQIRDCYIGMGVEPPAQYRVLGQGKYKYTGKYHYFDCYPEYHNHEADVPGYVPPVPL